MKKIIAMVCLVLCLTVVTASAYELVAPTPSRTGNFSHLESDS